MNDHMKKIYKQHGEGIQDPNLEMPVDPLFKDVLGSGVTRRSFLKSSVAAAAAAATVPYSAYAKKKWDPVIKLGYIPITDAAALLTAHEMGFFKKQGIDSVKPTLIRGWSPLVEAFSSHRFNLTHLLAPIPVAMRYNTNFPVKVTAWDHTNGSATVVGKHTGITKVEHLAGKQFAVPYWYSNHNIISQKMMRAAGITPVIKPQDAKLGPKECNIVVLPPPSMPPALAAKSIDAYCVAEPFAAMGEVKAGGKILRFTGDVWKGHPCCVVAMHEEDVMDPERAEWAQGVHNAIIEAQIYISENRDEMAGILSRDGKKYYPFPKKVVKRAMMYYDPAYYKNPHAIQHTEWGQDRINFQAWPYPSATKLNVQYLKDSVLTGDTAFVEKLDPEHVAKDLVNYDYVKKALEANPKWKNDSSVPQSGDPYTREELFVI
ncbi:MAG: ABC transporter substrate-binding protein [Gammaproteobacteria bacterium]|nr:ABC transporter substrate-binding protein [Gammaproteobacteria bacterium]